MSYNKKRHVALIQLAENRKNQGKSINSENGEALLELLKYNAQVENHIFWQNRSEFFSVINDFLDETIDATDFRWKLHYINMDNYYLYQEFKQDLKNLETFYPDSRSKDFTKFVIEIFSACDFFEPHKEEDEEWYKKWLKNFVQNAFLVLSIKIPVNLSYRYFD